MKDSQQMKSRMFLLLLCAVAALIPQLARAQQAGKFDYYLLSMSWSPEYCYSHQSSPECQRHLGLVVHGLWPQYNNAPRGPENCGSQPGLANPGAMLDIMPALGLIQHEWLTHGTCSGLSADQYFALIRQVFTRFHIPQPLQQAIRPRVARASDLLQTIEQANPGLTDNEIVFNCGGGYLREIQICLTKQGQPQPCSNLRGCSSPRLRIPAIR